MPDAATTTSQVAQLQVSAHTMALDPGLYCVFSVPGGPSPDTMSGLPAVRITAAPGKQAGEIDLAGLDPGGWVGPESAVLVRVGLMRSDLLVTVYQARDSNGEAPQLQVTRISAADAVPGAGAGAPGAGDAGARGAGAGSAGAGAAGAPERMDVVAHVYGMGDVGNRLGEWSGVPGSKRWIEGFGIAPAGVPQGDVEYQAVLGRGWLSPWSPGGQFCGSRGMSLPILGLRVRLRGESARSYAVSLTASFVDGSKVGPVTDGEACEAQSLAALEAFQVSIGPRGGSGKRGAVPAGGAAAKGGAKRAAEALPAPVPQPGAEGRLATPGGSKPGVAKQAVSKPGGSKPGVPKPGVPKPAAAKLAAAKLGAAKPEVAKAVAAKAGGKVALAAAPAAAADKQARRKPSRGG